LANDQDYGFLITWISVDAYQSFGQSCGLRKVGIYLPSTRLHIPEDLLVDSAVRTSVSVKNETIIIVIVMITLHIWLQATTCGSQHDYREGREEDCLPALNNQAVSDDTAHLLMKV
jgi:hypothetical protein